jgi:hypothetical protein
VKERGFFFVRFCFREIGEQPVAVAELDGATRPA